MPTNYKYPFASGEEIKKAASQINLNIEIENLQSSLLNAANLFKDIISAEVYARMLAHYNSGNYDPDGTAINDQLVQLCQIPLANLAMHDHFIWMQLNIGNNGITVVKSTNETAAFKYQTDEAKEMLWNTAWNAVTTLIDFMEADETTITEWDDSNQRKQLKELFFQDYREFDQYYGIDRNAAFYVRSRFLIKETLLADISPRVPRLDTIVDDVLLIKIKRYLAYRTIELAISRFDVLHLPQSIRVSINNQHTNKADDSNTIKEKLRNQIARKADLYLTEIDSYLAAKATDPTAETSPLDDYELNTDTEQKYFNAL